MPRPKERAESGSPWGMHAPSGMGKCLLSDYCNISGTSYVEILQLLPTEVKRTVLSQDDVSAYIHHRVRTFLTIQFWEVEDHPLSSTARV
jgi:hypothetical protein